MSYFGNFTPGLMTLMRTNPVVTARLASTRISPQQQAQLDKMNRLNARGSKPSRRPAPRAKSQSPYANEFDRLPAAEQRRQGGLVNFTHRRMNNLVDAQGQPATPHKQSGTS